MPGIWVTLFLTKTRWHLYKEIKRLYQFLEFDEFKTDPDKTQLGSIDTGFDWLKQWYSPQGLR